MSGYKKGIGDCIINVLSLFDGMSCGMIAMLNAGIKVDNYYAYEIDKYAIQTTQHNFPNIKQCGDVFDGDYTQYKDIDYLIGGSPCTFWSIAQLPDKRETTATGVGWELFSQYVRALHEAKPKWFIYENNKSMAKGIYDGISETFGFEPICINSALLSAQNRQRLYWVGKRNDDGTYRKVDIEQPEDRGILLQDILDNVVRFSRKTGIFDTKDKSLAICASDWRGVNRNQLQNAIAEPVLNETQVGALPRQNGELSTSQGFRIYSTNAKSVTLKSNSGGAGSKTGLYSTPVKVGEVGNGGQGNRIYASNGKAITQQANSGGMGSHTGLYAIPVEFENDKPIKAVSGADGKIYKVHEVINGMITIKDKTYPIKLQDGLYIIRKLTVSECKRLQTVPEWYEFPVSDTQSYKLMGNGWTCDVITHLIKATLN